jgi:hypothetical protein
VYGVGGVRQYFFYFIAILGLKYDEVGKIALVLSQGTKSVMLEFKHES